jgi:hypothetical protein
VSQWGVLLLMGYVAIGLSPVAAHKATRVAVLLTGFVIAAVLIRTGAAT